MSRDGRRIEYPAGSGRSAFYDARELEAMKGELAAAEAEGVAVARQMMTLHDVKVEFGVNLVLDRVELGPARPDDLVIEGGTS